MTQPTIELVHELRNGICVLWHRLAEMNGGVVNAGRIKDEEKLVGLLLTHCNQIRSALTAQAGVDFSEAWANRDYWIDKPRDKAAAEYWFNVGAGKLVPSRSILPAIAAAKGE